MLEEKRQGGQIIDDKKMKGHKIKKLIERVKLTDEEKRSARDKAIRKYHKLTPSWRQNDGDRFDVILSYSLEALLNNVLNDPDLFVKTGKELPDDILRDIPLLADILDGLGYFHVIPLRDAIKEVEGEKKWK